MRKLLALLSALLLVLACLSACDGTSGSTNADNKKDNSANDSSANNENNNTNNENGGTWQLAAPSQDPATAAANYEAAGYRTMLLTQDTEAGREALADGEAYFGIEGFVAYVSAAKIGDEVEERISVYYLDTVEHAEATLAVMRRTAEENAADDETNVLERVGTMVYFGQRRTVSSGSTTAGTDEQSAIPNADPETAKAHLAAAGYSVFLVRKDNGIGGSVIAAEESRFGGQGLEIIVSAYKGETPENEDSDSITIYYFDTAEHAAAAYDALRVSTAENTANSGVEVIVDFSGVMVWGGTVTAIAAAA